MRHTVHVILLALLSAACANGQQYDTVPAFPKLYFQRPVEIVHAGDGSNRLFVIEQAGIIRIFSNNPDVAKADTFLNISSKVNASFNETGLLGIAFHPNYKENGYFYLNYIAGTLNVDLRTVIARFTVDPTNPNKADAANEQIVMQINQPFENHNAGKLEFGPDGYLYISMGDGGNGNDPGNRAQNLNSLLGKMLRIDVNNTADGKNYAIPADNPLVGNQNGNPEEIWAWGLRNVWKFSFDPETGWLWAGDVGQGAWEEISLIEKGKNYGWNIMEGKHCRGSSTNCDTTGLVKPIWEYGRDQGVSITGGYVYRGALLPGLVGKYIYGDFGSGRVWALEYNGASAPVNTLLFRLSFFISSFGIDENNELLFSAFNGRIYRIRQASGSSVNATGADAALALHQPRPNPASGRVVIPFSLKTTAAISIALFDAAGRKVLQIFDGTREAGNHEVAFDASTISPGTYFCQLSNGTQTVIENLILLSR